MIDWDELDTRHNTNIPVLYSTLKYLEIIKARLIHKRCALLLAI